MDFTRSILRMSIGILVTTRTAQNTALIFFIYTRQTVHPSLQYSSNLFLRSDCLINHQASMET